MALHLESSEHGLNYTIHVNDATTDSSQRDKDRSCVSVICFHGSGIDSHYGTWRSLVIEMTKFATVLYYERRGPGTSSQSAHRNPRHQTSRDAVKDLEFLLNHTKLKPPYVLLAHFYGGTIAREFLQVHPEQVAGMVLAETGQETPTDHDEEQYRRRALGSKPLSVIHGDSLRDMRGADLSAEGRKMRQLWAEEDERLKKAQLQLSANARYVRVESCGHNVIRDGPDVVAEEVKWVLENVVLSGQQSPRSYSSFVHRAISFVFRRST